MGRSLTVANAAIFSLFAFMQWQLPMVHADQPSVVGDASPAQNHKKTEIGKRFRDDKSWRRAAQVGLTRNKDIRRFASTYGQQQTIGVALGGGSARALLHIGVLRWFECHHVPINYVAGTSGGALVGAMYAAGMSLDEIHEVFKNARWDETFRGRAPYRSVVFRDKQDQLEYPASLLQFGMKGLPQGLEGGQAVGQLYDEFALSCGALNTYDDLPLPFRCIATDLGKSDQRVFSDVPIAQALRATMAIPPFFTAAEITDRNGYSSFYGDGGLMNQVPADVAHAMGADVVFAVDVTGPPAGRSEFSTIFDIATNLYAVPRQPDIDRRLASPNVIDLSLGGEAAWMDAFDFSNAAEKQWELIGEAYLDKPENAALRALILKYQIGRPAWTAWNAARTGARSATINRLQMPGELTPTATVIDILHYDRSLSHAGPTASGAVTIPYHESAVFLGPKMQPPPMQTPTSKQVEEIRTVAGSFAARALTPQFPVRNDSPKDERHQNRASIEDDANALYASGRYESVGYQFGKTVLDMKGGAQSVLTIRAKEAVHGPPFLDFAIDGTYNGVDDAKANFRSRIIFFDQLLYGSETRMDISIGDHQRLAANLYMPLTTANFSNIFKRSSDKPGATDHIYVEPYAESDRRLVNDYSGDTRSAVIRIAQKSLGADIGVDGLRFDARIGYQFARLNESIVTGTVAQQVDFAQKFDSNPNAPRHWRALYRYDSTNSPSLPTTGIRASYQYLLYPIKPYAFQQSEARAAGFFTVLKTTYFGLISSGTTYGFSGASPLPFSLGGTFRLAEYPENRFTPRYYFYNGAGLLHKLRTLSPILGTAIRAGFWYERAQMNRDSSSTQLGPQPSLRQSFSGGAVIDTRLGPAFAALSSDS
jgi:predicted acylesterase/phospholipase RssA